MANKFEESSPTTREFTLEFLKQITDNFAEEHIIGRGGYGVVYKGVTEKGEEIALKKLHPVPGLDDTQFTNEFNNLMRAQHPNITRLVGYCYFKGHERIKLDDEIVFAHSEERLLCFEYLHGGSLDKHISDESCGLDWQTRFSIIRGVCEGLNYLHNGSPDPIYHLDLKPENILLDKNMVPKIGDFGLSRLFRSTRTHITTTIVGTRGYMPPEYVDRRESTPKYDVFSLGAIILRIIAGDEGYYRSVYMSSQEFFENVHENWEKRAKEKMVLYTSYQLKACVEIGLRSIEVDRKKRPTIAEIVTQLDKVDTADSSTTRQVTNLRRRHVFNENPNSESRGHISFSTTYRSPVPFDIFCCHVPFSFTDAEIHDEIHLTDGVSYNYNGRPIPPVALTALLKNPKLANVVNTNDADVVAGRVSGLVFVSERDDGLETLYIALRSNAHVSVKVFSLADIFGAADFSGMRLEDSGCFDVGYSVGSCTVDPSLIYVSTKESVQKFCGPWTVVYKTSLVTGKTERLSPQGVFDLNPSVSPSGKMVAVASFQENIWDYGNNYPETDIYVMNLDSEGCQGLGRELLIKNGGWPSWGSDNIIFFHRRIPTGLDSTYSCVFRRDIHNEETLQVTPYMLNAMTPAAISETKVAVATIRNKHHHIEIFNTEALGLPPLRITQKMWPQSNHYNPFVLDRGGRIGYHCFRRILRSDDYLEVQKLESSVKDVGLYRLSNLHGMFPSISVDGSKLAFVDEFNAVWVSDSQGRLCTVYESRGTSYVFYTAWNQNPDKDTLYVGLRSCYLNLCNLVNSLVSEFCFSVARHGTRLCVNVQPKL